MGKLDGERRQKSKAGWLMLGTITTSIVGWLVGDERQWESWMVIEGKGGDGGEAAKHDHFTENCSRQLGFNSTVVFT